MSQKVFKAKSHPITSDYRISDKVLGLGINGKVVECFSKANGHKFALKVRPTATTALSLHCLSFQSISFQYLFSSTFAYDCKCLKMTLILLKLNEFIECLQSIKTRNYRQMVFHCHRLDKKERPQMTALCFHLIMFTLNPVLTRHSC